VVQYAIEIGLDFARQFTLRITSTRADVTIVNLDYTSVQRIAQRTKLSFINGKNEFEFSDLNNSSSGVYPVKIQTRRENQILHIVK
jgi:hypothetical protein